MLVVTIGMPLRTCGRTDKSLGGPPYIYHTVEHKHLKESRNVNVLESAGGAGVTRN